jgi:hypothetical protein
MVTAKVRILSAGKKKTGWQDDRMGGRRLGRETVARNHPVNPVHPVC